MSGLGNYGLILTGEWMNATRWSMNMQPIEERRGKLVPHSTRKVGKRGSEDTAEGELVHQ
jgi:hypothetical protein